MNSVLITYARIEPTVKNIGFMRSSLLEVLRQDYLTTARAKGLSGEVVIGRHALKNALIPVVTIITVTMPRVVGASTVVETVFAYPGMGRFLYTSIMGNDYVVAMTVVMIIAVTVVGFNLIADIVYGWLDPRIRYQSLKRCLARSRRPGIGGSFGSAASATGL